MTKFETATAVNFVVVGAGAAGGVITDRRRVRITLAAGVVTWALSPIKFQADMGLLLTFMFLWNMVGALILIPALSHFLLNTAETTSTSLKVAS